MFDKGIYVIATDVDPTTLMETGEYTDINDFWSKLKDEVTQSPSITDFISVLISRGDLPTGGYQIRAHLIIAYLMCLLPLSLV